MAFLDFLSSFSPRVLFEETSPVSGEIKVIQKGKERQLLVSGVRQSINFDAPGIENRYWGKVSETASQLGSLSARQPDSLSALILGLGAGTVAHLLAQKFPGAEIDGVELDPVMIEVARKFFDLAKIPNLNVVCADAYDIVTSAGKTPPRKASEENPRQGKPSRFRNPNLEGLGIGADYDFILSDLYCGSRFPEKFAYEDFLRGVRELLAPGGLAIFNRVIRQGHRESLKDFVEKIRKIFVRVEEVEVPGPSGFSNLLISARS